jgi:hypothetical protein
VPFGDNVDLDRYGRAAGHLRRIKRPALEPPCCIVIGQPLQPCNRAPFLPLPVPIVLLAHARELEIREDNA